MLLSEGFEADLAATGVAFGAFDDLAPLLLAIRIGGHGCYGSRVTLQRLKIRAWY